MNLKPKISIIFPTYNGANYLSKTLESIKKLKNIEEIELVIIDNNSNDETLNIINSYFSTLNINLIKQKQNLGFAKACNIGAQLAKGRFLFITNQDIIFFDDFFQKLISIYNEYSQNDEKRWRSKY